MDKQAIQSICVQVYRRFPELKGRSPQVKTIGDNQLLIFQATAKTADGHALPRTVRVVVNPAGKVIKITTSR